MSVGFSASILDSRARASSALWVCRWEAPQIADLCRSPQTSSDLFWIPFDSNRKNNNKILDSLDIFFFCWIRLDYLLREVLAEPRFPNINQRSVAWIAELCVAQRRQSNILHIVASEWNEQRLQRIVIGIFTWAGKCSVQEEMIEK